MSTATRTHKLHGRKGSIAAPDPFAQHVDDNPTRTVSSTLTIVSVADDSAVDNRTRRRRSSGGSSHSTGSGRLSFAFNSFTPIHAPEAKRPASPFTHSRKSSYSASTPERPLTPAELVDLAQSVAHSTDVAEHEPAPLLPLDDSIYLPFIERPAEIETLISTSPTARIFALLAKSLPQGAEKDVISVDGDPAQWTYTQLLHWLTRVDRPAADDREWVRCARACIAPRSEVVWERVKGAFGVPPELDVTGEDFGHTALSIDTRCLVDIESVFVSSAEHSPALSPPLSPALSAAGSLQTSLSPAQSVHGLRIFTTPGMIPTGHHEPAAVHVVPHFPTSFSELGPASPRAKSTNSPRAVNSPGQYAHIVAQRLLENNSPSSRRSMQYSNPAPADRD